MRDEPGGGDIGIGGATLAGQAAQLGLIDELRLTVHPWCSAVASRSTRAASAASTWSCSGLGPSARAPSTCATDRRSTGTS